MSGRRSAASLPCAFLGARKMEHLLHVDHVIHDLGLTHVSWNSVQYERVDVRLELVRVYGRIDRLPPKLHCDIVRNELAFARILKEGFAYLCARVYGAEYVATSAMIVTRDRAEGFALRAFAAARRAKKEKSVGISSWRNLAYTAKGTGKASTVIPSEVEESRGVTARSCNGIFDPESFRGSR